MAVMQDPSAALVGETPYNNEFFDKIDASAISSAREIIPILGKIISFESVVDVGCGRGAWLKVFLECGANAIEGLDNSYVDASRLLIPTTCFKPTDLAKPFTIERDFDLAVCLEVGEHLPRSAAKPLIDTLCRAAPAVLFSAAIPGQGGTHHINEQWPFFWANLFAANGYEKLDPIRRNVLANPNVAEWYKQNAFLFVAEHLLKHNKRLLQEYEVATSVTMDIIASSRLIPLMSVRGLIAELARALIRSLKRRLE